MNDEQRGKIAFEIHTRIKDRENQRRLLLAENAKDLNTMLVQKYYKDILGAEDGEWAGYLSDIQVFYTRNQVDVMTRIYKKLSVKLNIPQEVWIEVPLGRLVDILPIVTTENYVKWFSKALVLTTRDWNIELRTAKGLTNEEDEHEHKFIQYETCSTCGKKQKIRHNHETDR